MSEPTVDPSGNTEAFRAFTEQTPPEPATASRTPLIVGALIVVVVLAAAVGWLLSR